MSELYRIEIHEPIQPNIEKLNEFIAVMRKVLDNMEAHPDEYSAMEFEFNCEHINWRQQLYAYDRGLPYPKRLSEVKLTARWNEQGELDELTEEK